MNDLDTEYFNNNFFDIRKHRPQKGQILAQYRAVAHFVDGWVKRNLINVLLTNKVGAKTAQKVMRNMCCATEEDSINIPLQMAKDLAEGMTVEEVAAKEYRMVVQYNYWTKKECVPEDDPHWLTIDIVNNQSIT